jgi:Domain of unknown function (DUF4259)
MGTWQVGPFDNDVAMEFFDEVEITPDPQIADTLRRALAAVVDRPGRLELGEGHVAFAAASLVAAGGPGWAQTGNPTVDEWLTAHRPSVGPPERRVALAALDRISGPDSEWMVLWAATESEADVQERLRALRAALNQALAED